MPFPPPSLKRPAPHAAKRSALNPRAWQDHPALDAGGRVILSGSQGVSSSIGRGGASAEDALESSAPAFPWRKGSGDSGDILFPPMLPPSSPSRPVNE
ncbi:MAG: hypothetical protein HY882_02860 [Deltaproteobacteria bacterium]|nr:hypothetical protein [Deltaproteobacteria bacterium]